MTMADRLRWPRHPEPVVLADLIQWTSASSSAGPASAPWSDAQVAAAVVEALKAVQIETVHDLVRCEWAAHGPDDGVWLLAGNAFLAHSDVAQPEKARALRAFWDMLDALYAQALDACAGETQAVQVLLSREMADDANEERTGASVMRLDLLRTLALPRDVAQYLPTPVELGRQGELVHIAGVRGSGRGTVRVHAAVGRLIGREVAADGS